MFLLDNQTENREQEYSHRRIKRAVSFASSNRVHSTSVCAVESAVTVPLLAIGYLRVLPLEFIHSDAESAATGFPFLLCLLDVRVLLCSEIENSFANSSSTFSRRHVLTLQQT